jgi:2-phospho-L-lactate guanylyltransferase
MKLWLVIPVKPLEEAKSRLADTLTPAQRAELMRGLLQHVLDQANAAGVLHEIVVISRDPQVWAIAHLAGAGVIHEQGKELNQALEQARQQALAYQADALLVLPADLPLLTVEDIQGLAAYAARQRSVVIAPSQDGGTSALALHPPTVIPFAFGPDSFARHCQAAQQAGVPCQVYDSPTLAFDVDVRADWQRLQLNREMES